MAKPTTDKNSNSDVYRTRLLHLRARLCGEMGRMADAALNQGRSETSSLPIHLADLGSDNFEQELTLSLVGSEKEALDKIEFALERIADGSYGKCEDCGKKIPESRLEAIPYTAVCVQCAASQEQRAAARSSRSWVLGHCGLRSWTKTEGQRPKILSSADSPGPVPRRPPAGHSAAGPNRATSGEDWPRCRERP